MLGIRRLQGIPNAWVRGLCEAEKEMKFSCIERTKDNRSAERVYEAECIGSIPEGQHDD